MYSVCISYFIIKKIFALHFLLTRFFRFLASSWHRWLKAVAITPWRHSALYSCCTISRRYRHNVSQFLPELAIHIYVYKGGSVSRFTGLHKRSQPFDLVLEFSISIRRSVYHRLLDLHQITLVGILITMSVARQQRPSQRSALGRLRRVFDLRIGRIYYWNL